MQGYNNKILHIDLSKKSFWVEEPELEFYRRYFGGSAMGAYYALKNIPRGIDPLDSRNVLTIAASIITGASAPFLSRFSVTAKSPITGGIGDAQAGGWFGPELKFSGYDAVVIVGKAASPVYLSIIHGTVTFHDAKDIWGQDTVEAEENIREALKEPRARVLGIGKAGENLVRYACIINEGKHAAGRTGMGAVMGSKNLKGIAVKGDKSNMQLSDAETLKALVKEEIKTIKDDPMMQTLKTLGTNDAYEMQQEIGGLPTRNFKHGVFDDYKALAPEKLHEMYYKNASCYACPVACKITLKSKDVDPRYGGPEYETVASLGSYLMNANKEILVKANELCNRYTIDTISLGGMIAFLMECNENGLLSESIKEGLDISFGNSQVIIPLIEKVAENKTELGRLMAMGPKAASAVIGKESYKYAIEVKGNPLPAHMPRQKNSMALIYAVNPYGADHCSSLEDYIYFDGLPEEDRGFMRSLDLNTFGDYDGITLAKTRMILYTQIYHGFIDSIGICMFSSFFMNPNRINELISAITGWETSLFEYMKVGERKVNMMKVFNQREGFTIEDDYIPERLYEPLESGPTKGSCISKEDLQKAIFDYYDLAGWDRISGGPSLGKLKDLDLEWIYSEKEL